MGPIIINLNHLTISLTLIIIATTLSSSSSSSSSSSIGEQQQQQSSSSQATSFYDVLSSNGLPIGLFPAGISDFSVDPSSGVFRVRLPPPSPCDACFETRVRYERDISGGLSYGRIANLTGVSAEELFLWLPVRGIQVDVPTSGLIYFHVGVVSKQFSLSIFDTPKDCNAVVEEEDANDVVLFDAGRVRFVENQSRKFVRKRVVDQEERAVS